MRNLKINQSKLYVLNYKGKTKTTDLSGNYTGEETITYDDPIMFMGHVSGARGSSQVEIFGTDVMYDKTVVITKAEFETLKINENSVFFIDKEPIYDATVTTMPLYNYRVSRIAETINEVAIAVKKVEQ